jgi:hypothetical protein
MNTNGIRADIAMASTEPENFRNRMALVPGIMFMFPSKIFSALLGP